MEKFKTDRIEAISDEVGELHELLKVLLPKLPRVEHVDYTHGSREMGADLVISRRDDTFKETEYVGVIAKIGRVAQDYSDIERQIKECALPRTVSGGKKKVYLSEIWILTTGSISQGAQDKIQHEYSTRKIKFIPGSRIAELVDEHMSNYWSDVPLAVGEHLTRIWTYNDQLDRRLSLLQTGDKALYIDQDVFPIVAKEYPKKKRRILPINIFALIEGYRSTLIEGGMGAGKSKLLRTLINHYATAPNYVQKKLLPVYATYKDFVEKYDLTPRKMVDSLVDEKTRRDLPPENQFLLLVDGADEKDAPLKELLDNLSSAFEAVNATNDLRLVVTSRYLGDLDNEKAVLKGASRFELRHLSTDRLIEFIRAICETFKNSTRLLEDLKKSSLFKELPRSPIAAILLARLMNENREELPSNMTELYTKYTELLLGRWDIEKGLQSQREYEALDKILTRIATFVIENQLSTISLQDAREIANKYLAPRRLEVEPQELFDKMVRRCEIICVDQTKNILYFKHRTFAEYFYARSLLKKQPLIDQRLFQIYWMNSFFFYVGLQRDCPELLESILELEPLSEPQRWLKIVNMPMYFLAGYASPYEVIQKGVARMILDAARLYRDVIMKKQDTFLAKFSKMQLLCILQSVVRKSYSYKFFKPALEEAALTISATELDDDVGAAALFFLSVTNIELDDANKNSFDFLLEKYLDRLPLELQLAIKHEEPKGRTRTDLLKRFDKRFGRILSTADNSDKNVEFRKQRKAAMDKKLEDLYEKPIRLLKIT